jgi:hypothetical protein
MNEDSPRHIVQDDIRLVKYRVAHCSHKLWCPHVTKANELGDSKHTTQV